MCDIHWPEFQTGSQLRVNSWLFTGFPVVPSGWHPRVRPNRGRGWLNKLSRCVYHQAPVYYCEISPRLLGDGAVSAGVGIPEEVTLTQLSTTPYQFRDAVRFSNGREIRLQDLNEGMRVDVLSLSSEDFEHQERRQIEEEYQHIFT